MTTFRDEAEALEIANDTLYGLGAGVWTRDGSRAFRMGRAIKAGRVWTNCYHQYPAHAAFGGYKASGVGPREPPHDARALHADQVPAGQLRPQPARVLLGWRTAAERRRRDRDPEALDMIERLGAAHGALVFFQSGGCCDGSSPMCLRQGELPPAPQDVRLGEIGGAPFYIDAEQYERWGRPRPHHRSLPRRG